jgi:hypothetical protein
MRCVTLPPFIESRLSTPDSSRLLFISFSIIRRGRQVVPFLSVDTWSTAFDIPVNSRRGPHGYLKGYRLTMT